MRSLDTQLSKYAYHLLWAFSLLSKQGLDLSNSVFVDHGGGVGLLGMLAKETGIGTVIYNDIDNKFLTLAKVVSKEIGLTLDHYVLGDIDQLVAFVQENKYSCSIVASYDVIEHIYDMDYFFMKASCLSHGSLGLIMSSAANMYNPRYVLKTIPKQIVAEKKYTHTRRELIRLLYPELVDSKVVLLSRKTRGLRKDDIRVFCEEYLKNKVLKRSQHRTNSFDPFNTNTCSPETGYWAEHFLNPFTLRNILQDHGFQCEVKTGRYHGSKRRITKNSLNLLLKLGGNYCLPIAPYYSIVALKP